jgi:5,10-methylenetetrahydrofolate reductase
VAQFNWSGTPRFGCCAVCGTSELDSGFVDMIGDTNVIGEQGDIVGIVDMIVCARCVQEAARLVGCATPQEVNDLMAEKISREEKIENLEKELEASQERFLTLINFTKEDFDKITERVGTTAPSPAPTDAK